MQHSENNIQGVNTYITFSQENGKVTQAQIKPCQTIVIKIDLLQYLLKSNNTVMTDYLKT